MLCVDEVNSGMDGKSMWMESRWMDDGRVKEEERHEQLFLTDKKYLFFDWLS